MKKTKTVCIIIVAAAVLTVSLFNIFYPDRPTVSVRENRMLKTFPTFSLSAFVDGSFFSDIDEFVSDNFIGRETLVDIAQKVKTSYSLSAFFPNDEEDIVFLPSKTGQTSDNKYSGETSDTSDLSDAGSNTDTSDDTGNKTPTQRPVLDINEIPENMRDPDTSNKTEDTSSSDDMSSDGGLTPDDTTPADDVNDDKTQDTDITVDPDNEQVPDDGEHSEEASDPVLSDDKTPDDEDQTEDTSPVPEYPVPDAEVKEVEKNDDETAEFLSDGYIIYRNAVYSIPYLVRSVAEKYGKAVDHYAELFPDARVTILVAPLSSGMIDNEAVRKKITDQESIINTVNSYCGDNINKINVYSILYEHRNEHIYFSSDHHWTALGAYYAYTEFARSVGLEPTPISQMENVLLNPAWKGTAYSMTGDERTKEFSDALYAYLPTKANTMTIYASDGSTTKKNGCIRTSYKSYTAFIDGDNPYTIISVPENPSDMTVLVIKDSYGNAFVPYLCEHYSTIIVADPRHITFDLYDLLKDYPLKDIIFMTNIYNPNVASWVRNVNRIVGN